MSKNIMLGGNDAVALAAKQSFVDVVSAYPITPQTSIIEKIANYIADGAIDTTFIKVESEHSAMAAAIGASVSGSRVFTATSSQGLLLMHEVLHWASGARLPIVMANANRAVAPPWSIWAESTDSLSQRDTGWIQIYVSNAQEAYDFTIMGFRIAEKVLFPAMICMDGFLLTHTKEPVKIFDDEEIADFIKVKEPRKILDTYKPEAFGALAFPNDYMKIKAAQHNNMVSGIENIKEIMGEFNRLYGRNYSSIDIYGDENAEVSIVTIGTLAETAHLTVDKLNKEGIGCKLVNLHILRPFPKEDLQKALSASKHIVVFDRNISHGKGGIIKDETAGGLGLSNVIGFVCGLGGFDVTDDDMARAVRGVVNGTIKEDSIIGAEL